jgi:hypothetical protein
MMESAETPDPSLFLATTIFQAQSKAHGNNTKPDFSACLLLGVQWPTEKVFRTLPHHAKETDRIIMKEVEKFSSRM